MTFKEKVIEAIERAEEVDECAVLDKTSQYWLLKELKNENNSEPSCDDVKVAYDQGLNDAWELMCKINKLSIEELEKVFGRRFQYITEIIETITPQEALAKLKAHEDSKIKVGDVVIHEETGMKFLIITHEKGDFYKFGVIDLEKMTLDKIANNTSAFKKTGKHIDVQNILEELKGE